MRSTRTPAALAGLALMAAACGGTGATFTTGTATTEPPTTATTTSTTTTAAPPTTTSPTTSATTATTTVPATTTLAPAVPVAGWEGEGIRDLTVEITFDPPIAALDMGMVARRDLAVMGIDAGDASGTVLAFALDGAGLADGYTGVGDCYTGARVNGTVTLTAPGRPALKARLSGEIPTAKVVFTCEKDEDYAPFDHAFEKGLLPVLAGFWGPAAAPLLVEVVARDIESSTLDLALKAVAMDESRGLDPGDLSFGHRRAMLEAALEVIAYLVETGYTPHGADQAARRLLTAYSGTDFGAAAQEDVDEWRAWLDGWVAGGGS
ncbi:MAG: hypothetical protein ABIJ48_12775 [Actinomycetota bacterium]